MEQVSIGQLHWSAAKYAPLQEWAMVNGIADCYEAGLMRNVGVSNYGPQQLRKVRPESPLEGARGTPLSQQVAPCAQPAMRGLLPLQHGCVQQA